MDDRIWTSTECWAAIEPIAVWGRFSEDTLLKENLGKIQLAARTKKQKEELLRMIRKDYSELEDKIN